MAEYDLVIVGAGLSGLSAAKQASELDLKTLLVDERKTLGGSEAGEIGAGFDEQAPWQIPPVTDGEASRKILQDLTASPALEKVDVRLESLAWGIFPEGDGFRLALTHDGATRAVTASAIIIATGTYVVPHPFQGIDLPQVLAPSQVDRKKQEGVFAPGQAAVIYGDNEIADGLAAILRDEGVAIAARLRDPGDARQSNGTVTVQGAVELSGDGALETVKFSAASGAQEISADWLVVTSPAAYSHELASQAGCTARWTGYSRGYIPEFDAAMGTSVAGISVAGSVAGARGAGERAASGRLAAAAIARSLGKDVPDLPLATAPAWSDLIEEDPDEPPPGSFYQALDDLEPDHVICPCKDHLLGEVMTSIHLGCRTIDDVKRIAGAGMGHCQARKCHRAVVYLLNRLGGVEPSETRPMRVRPPVRRLTVSAMLESEVRS
ncbi:MAG: FAD-dependent oxidoreductase [Thermaerobacterales bacterium]